jgi:predicted PurR-regulated permease PerM
MTSSGSTGPGVTSNSPSSAAAVTETGGGLPRVVKVLLGAATALVVAGGIRGANDILAPVMLALVLTIAVAPIRGVALRRGVPRWAATVLAMVTVYAIVLFLAVSVAVALVQLAATLPQYAGQVDDLTAQVHEALTKAGVASAPSGQALSELDLGKLTGLITDLLSGLLSVLSSFFFLATLLFFMTADGGSTHLRADVLRRSRPALTEALIRFTHGTQTYLIVSAVFGGIVAVLDTAALWLIGVPLAGLWGLLAFVTNFIPNVGFFIGLVPPALLGLLEGGWKMMLAVILVYCVLNVVIQTFIQPRYVADAVGLNMTTTFLSLAVWTYLLGPLGALLAVPMTLLTRALLVDPDESAHWVDLLIGSAPPTPEEIAAVPTGEPVSAPKAEPVAVPQADEVAAPQAADVPKPGRPVPEHT